MLADMLIQVPRSGPWMFERIRSACLSFLCKYEWEEEWKYHVENEVEEISINGILFLCILILSCTNKEFQHS